MQSDHIQRTLRGISWAFRPYLVVAAILGAVIAVPAASAQTTRYVDDDAPLAGDGTSWPTAYKYLQDALAEAASNPAVSEIRIAGGVHKPDQDEAGNVTPGDYEATFRLISGVALYGGYAGLADPNNPDLRDIALHESILSGDLLGNDGPGFQHMHENSWHVVTASGTDSTAVLSGLTITAGYGVASGDPGAGMANDTGCPTLTDCTFRRNWGSTGGGLSNDSADPTLTNCTFTYNSAVNGGGMRNERDSRPILRNCTFIANKGTTGAAMSNHASSPTLVNCTLDGNRASSGGAMHNTVESNPTLVNCTFNGNRATSGGAVSNYGGSSPTLVNCTFCGNRATSGGAMSNGDESSPTLVNCTFSGNWAVSCGGIHNTTADPRLVSCILWQNSGQQIAGGSPLVTYSCVQGGWPGVGNVDADPLFTGGPSGAWTSDATYHPGTYHVILTDSTAGWQVGELVDKLLNPDTSQPLQFAIVANTTNTVTILADWDTMYAGVSWVTSGMTYQVYDYHLTGSSPCIDAGCNCGVPSDSLDLDGDGNVAEYTPFDLDGEGRFFDDPNTPDSGDGRPPVVDMGAYESGGTDPPPCRGDIDGDRDVDIGDLVVLLANYGTTAGVGAADGDLDCDADVDLSDLAALLAVYGTTCE